MARLARLRSRIEPDYRELDDALRLDHHCAVEEAACTDRLEHVPYGGGTVF